MPSVGAAVSCKDMLQDVEVCAALGVPPASSHVIHLRWSAHTIGRFFPVAEVLQSPFPPCAYSRRLERRSTLSACRLSRAIQSSAFWEIGAASGSWLLCGVACRYVVLAIDKLAPHPVPPPYPFKPSSLSDIYPPRVVPQVCHFVRVCLSRGTNARSASTSQFLGHHLNGWFAPQPRRQFAVCPLLVRLFLPV